MKSFAYFLLLFVICTAFFAVGCNGSIQAKKNEFPSKKESPAFLQALSDFEFVGSVPISNDGKIPPHGISRKTFPLQLETNMQYIFHHRRINEGDESLFDVLKNRLQTNGVTILEAKIGPATFIGGSEFHVSFKEGGVEGTIFSSLDRQIMNSSGIYEQWDSNDYVVELKTVGGSKVQ